MVNSDKKGEFAVRSRLKQLILEKEVALGDRITNKSIAAETGLDENTISRWMSPKPFHHISTVPITALCKYLDCEIGDLLYVDRSAK